MAIRPSTPTMPTIVSSRNATALLTFNSLVCILDQKFTPARHALLDHRRIEASRLNRKPKLEIRKSIQRAACGALIGGRTFPAIRNLRVESHDMYEKTGTYAKNARFVGKRILLITSWLSSRLNLNGGNQGELKLRAKATMLLKTKGSKSLDLVKATMLMKINDLNFQSHDMYEKKVA